MNDLFAPAIPAENLLSRKLRVHMVDGDGFEPELKSRRDYVLLAPVESYQGDGIYLVQSGCGETLYRVRTTLDRTQRLRLSNDNPLYRGHEYYVSVDRFADDVLGIVVADIRVRDDQSLRRAVT